MFAEVLFLEGVLQIPFRGDVPLMVAAGSLLIIAYLSLGALLQLLVGDLATGLGLAGLIASPAFGYAGVGFPTIGMNTFAQAWSAMLPLRWYMAVLLGQAARGLPVSDSAVPFAALAGLTVLFAGLALLRMTSLTRKRWFETARPAEQLQKMDGLTTRVFLETKRLRLRTITGTLITWIIRLRTYSVTWGNAARSASDSRIDHLHKRR